MATSPPHDIEPTSVEETGWSTLHRHHFGIDIGAGSIKCAAVDIARGALATPLREVPTPVPATPTVVAETLIGLMEHQSPLTPVVHPEASIGVALPAIIRQGTACSAANIDPGWIGLDVPRFLTERLGRTVLVLNDADAAGIAEARYGAGREEGGRAVAGTVLLITLGTGIGSALILDGQVVPNLELGHLEIDGAPAETWASARAQQREEMDWATYASHLQRYFTHLEFLFSPEKIIVGGSMSDHIELFLPYLCLDTPVVPAQLRDTAGVIGAARHAFQTVPPLG